MDEISHEEWAQLEECFGKASKVSVSVEDFPLEEIRHQVASKGLQGACRTFVESAEALMELRELERKVDVGKLRDMFAEGRCEVRGRDIDNRPVVWLQSPQNALAMKKPYAEFFVYVLWIFSWGLRCRNCETSGVFMVVDDSIRALLDFNLANLLAFVDLLRRFEMRVHPDSRMRFVIKNNVAKTTAEFVWRLRGWSEVDRLKILHMNDKKQVLHQLADPQNYPEWFLPGGKPYEPSFDAIGEWSYMSFPEVGFKNLSLRDIWRPHPSMIQQRRLASEEISLRENRLICRIPFKTRDERGVVPTGKANYLHPPEVPVEAEGTCVEIMIQKKEFHSMSSQESPLICYKHPTAIGWPSDPSPAATSLQSSRECRSIDSLCSNNLIPIPEDQELPHLHEKVIN